MKQESTKQAPAIQEKPETATKQAAAFARLHDAVVKAGKRFEDGGTNNKLRVAKVNGVMVTVGVGGGYNIPAVHTYAKADVATMVKADELLVKQAARKVKAAETVAA